MCTCRSWAVVGMISRDATVSCYVVHLLGTPRLLHHKAVIADYELLLLEAYLSPQGSSVSWCRGCKCSVFVFLCVCARSNVSKGVIHHGFGSRSNAALKCQSATPLHSGEGLM